MLTEQESGGGDISVVWRHFKISDNIKKKLGCNL